jgi:hypothetical protein
MGIEPTRDSCEPHTGFEDQGHHQEPVTSEEENTILANKGDRGQGTGDRGRGTGKRGQGTANRGYL